MPGESVFYINIDDESPLVSYNPPSSWENQESSDDSTTAEKSSQSTFHVTKAINATAELTFVGTGVYVYGSKTRDHKSYAFILDNGTMIEGLSAESSKAVYKSSLAVVRHLPLGLHTIKIINMGDEAKKTGGTLDIDEFFVEFDVGPDKNKHRGIALVDDNDTSLLKYSNGWGLTSLGGPASRFINDTVHETTTPGSSVTWDFYGSGVQVIGGVGPENGGYSVKVDGMNFTMDASTENFVASHMLFHLDNLTSSHHTLTLTHTGAKGKALTVDYFMAFNSTNGTIAGSSHEHEDDNYEESEKKLKPGAIAAIIIVILLIIGLIAGGVLYMYRRRRAEAQALSREITSNPSAYPGVYGGGEPRDLEAGLNRRASQSSSTSGQTMVGKANDNAKKFGDWLGFKSSADTAPAPTQQQNRDVEISAPLGNGNGRLNPAARYSKATSFDEAWDKRDRRQVQSVYEDVDLQTPNAPPAHYNHGRSLSSPNPVTPMAHRRRFDDDYRDSTNSFDPRAPWDPRRAPADYEPSFDDRNRRGYDRDRGRDDEYSRDRYDSRPAQSYRPYR